MSTTDARNQRRTNYQRVEEGFELPFFWKGTREKWHPTRDCETLHRIPTNIPPCGPLSLLAGGSSPTGHGRLKYRHPIQNKGDRSDCTNYWGMSLLRIVGKLFARVALKRLQFIAERVYPESHRGFRANRSTYDMVLSIRQLQEKCRKQRKPLYIASIDLTNAFDLVSRDGLFKILPRLTPQHHQIFS